MRDDSGAQPGDRTLNPEPFQIRFPEERLDDLRGRLRAARFAPDAQNDDWSYGVNGDYLAELVRYWHSDFDWRAREAELNRYDHFRVEIDGLPIHFLHARGVGPSPVPIVLTHGWPWTFWDFRDVIGPLADPAAHGGDPADAFDVVVPSLPGFAFSTPLPGLGMPAWDVADVWVKLMRDVLGYERFGSHAGDMGTLVGAQLGHKFAEHVIGLHFAPRPLRLETFNVDRPWAQLLAASHGGAAEPAGLLDWEKRKTGHLVANVLDPQTLAYAMHDSPLGLAAWLLQRRYSWSDCGGDVERAFDRDFLLTNFTLFWLTDSFVSSVRMYRENWQRRWTPSHGGSRVVDAPTGVTLFVPDLPPGAPTDWMADYFDLRFVKESPVGGHFAAAEQPQRVVEDVREFFRPLR